MDGVEGEDEPLDGDAADEVQPSWVIAKHEGRFRVRCDDGTVRWAEGDTLLATFEGRGLLIGF